VNFAAITHCVASQRVFIVVSVYFVIDSVRKLLDTPSYTPFLYMNHHPPILMLTDRGLYLELNIKAAMNYYKCSLTVP
jgi:hypothetical protein